MGNVDGTYKRPVTEDTPVPHVYAPFGDTGHMLCIYCASEMRRGYPASCPGFQDPNRVPETLESLIQDLKGEEPEKVDVDLTTGKVITDPGARKYDHDKPDLSLLLLFGEAMTQVAAVGTYGAKKYSRGGWQKCEDGVNRYTAAMMRHLMAENLTPNDPETGLLHATHAAWNALARLELMLRESKKEQGKPDAPKSI